MVDLAFQVPGVLAKIPVKEGERVSKGALIAQLRQDEFQARLQSHARPARSGPRAVGWQPNRGSRTPKQNQNDTDDSSTPVQSHALTSMPLKPLTPLRRKVTTLSRRRSAHSKAA